MNKLFKNNRDVLDCLKNYLEYLKQSGINHLPKSDFPNGHNDALETRRKTECAHKKKVEPDKKSLSHIKKTIGNCKRCKLSDTRHSIVFGSGNADANLMFIGEAPGRDEDLQGKPFVGKAGELLTKIISAIDLKREDVYIANIIKCRPPGNRDPLPDEIENCEPFLLQQIEAVRPHVICALGRLASQTLLKTDAPISTMRGRFHDFHGIPLMPTYHPAYLLRNPLGKRKVWEDIKKVKDILNKKNKIFT